MNPVRSPAVAGYFYPSKREDLKAEILKLMQKATRTKGQKPRLLIVPHAGYSYSGQTAAQAFREVVEQEFDQVVILGPSHHHAFTGLVSSGAPAWRTPLGESKVIQTWQGPWKTLEAFHQSEHSLEVELPFVQSLFPQAEILPLLVSGSYAQAESLAQQLARLDHPRLLWVFSSDFCHAGPRFGYDPRRFGFDNSENLDQEACQLISSGRTQGFYDFLEVTQATICGALPILVAMHLAKCLGRPDFKLKAYDSSARQTGDQNSVGYAALFA